jgi:hypothetical protein
VASHVDRRESKGVVEGVRPGERLHYSNRNAPAIDKQGLPSKPKAVAEDRIGANVDDSEVSNASETGQTSDAPRDEVKPLEED